MQNYAFSKKKTSFGRFLAKKTVAVWVIQIIIYIFALDLHNIYTMEYIKTAIEGVYIIQPKVFEDARGYFFEAFKMEEFVKNIGKIDFIQDNESKSSKGVLRGLHYQKGEFSQAKLVRVI